MQSQREKNRFIRCIFWLEPGISAATPLAHHLKEAVKFPVPHRQYVFSIPKIIRKFFLYVRKLLGKLCRCALKSISKFLKTILGKQHGIIGFVMVIQSFGDYARWHPHLHALVADGLFLNSGYFYVMPHGSYASLCRNVPGKWRGDRKKQGMAAKRFDSTADEHVIDIRSCKKGEYRL